MTAPFAMRAGVKDNQLSSLDGSLLPDTLEWLIAASNQISHWGRMRPAWGRHLKHHSISIWYTISCMAM